MPPASAPVACSFPCCDKRFSGRIRLETQPPKLLYNPSEKRAPFGWLYGRARQAIERGTGCRLPA